MRIVVTGGCGYIGAAVVRLLVERGDHVLNLDNRKKTLPVPALGPILGRENHVRLESTIRDATMLRAMFHEFRPDRVIHLASASAGQPPALFESEIATAFAVLGACREHVLRLDEAARRDFRLVQATRLPRPTGHPAEGASLARRAAQHAADGLITQWCRASGLALVTCMADEVFGPGQDPAALLPSALAAVQSEQAFEPPANGMIVRDYLPLAEFAMGLVLAADRGAPMGYYELSAGAERRDLEVLESSFALLDKRRPRAGGSWMKFLAGGQPRWKDTFSPALDSSDARRDFGWNPGHNCFYEGLSRTVAWSVSQAQSSPATPAATPAAAE